MRRAPGSPPGTAASEAPRQADLFSFPPPVIPPSVPPAPAIAQPAPIQLAREPVPQPPAYPWRKPVSAPGLPAAPSTAADAERGRQVLTVSEVTRQIKGTLERGFPRVLVRGEISGYRGPNARGHLYFSLKDKDACLDARIWASAAQRMKFKLRDGLSVIAEGSVDVYEPQGRYSLIVQRIEPEGEGALALAFQQLKEKLLAEGLFGERRKRAIRPLPFLPRRIGVVTSRTGAALYDFLRVLHQRHPRLPVLLCHARVQGEYAVDEVVHALRRLARSDVDVIVVTRGGGSIEDLWTFNEEAVARAIFDCPVPVVSAVGHEVDFTIADFVADYRAPTPSAAAERLAPVLQDLELALATSRRRLHKAVDRVVMERRQGLHRASVRIIDPRRMLAQRRLYLSEQADLLDRGFRLGLRNRRELQRALLERLNRRRPQAQVKEHREQMARLKTRLHAVIRERLREHQGRLLQKRQRLARGSPQANIRRRRSQLGVLSAAIHRQRGLLSEHQGKFRDLLAKLEAMSPLRVMARGYSVTFRRADGQLVRGASEVRVGDEIAVRFAREDSLLLADCEEVDARVIAVTARPRPG